MKEECLQFNSDLNEHLPGRWVGRAADTSLSEPVHPGHQTWQCVISSCGVSSRTVFTSHHSQRHYQNCESAWTPQSGTSHKTCLRGFGGNGSIAWTSAVSHEGRKLNAFKVTMKLQTFLFQMVVTGIYVQYLWKYGFAKSSDNLYAPCIIQQHIFFQIHFNFTFTSIRHLLSILFSGGCWMKFYTYLFQILRCY